MDISCAHVFHLLTIYYPWGAIFELGRHGGRVVTLSPATSGIGVRFPARPQVGKLAVACRWLAIYITEPWPTVCTQVSSALATTCHVESDVKPQINKINKYYQVVKTASTADTRLWGHCFIWTENTHKSSDVLTNWGTRSESMEGQTVKTWVTSTDGPVCFYQ